MVARLIQSQSKCIISNIGNLQNTGCFLPLPFKLLNFPKIRQCFKPIFYCCDCIKNACGQNTFFKNNVCTLNQQSQHIYSFQQIFERLLPGPDTVVSKTDKTVPAFMELTFSYLYGNKNLHSRRISQYLIRKVTLPKQLLKAVQKPFLFSNSYSFM